MSKLMSVILVASLVGVSRADISPRYVPPKPTDKNAHSREQLVSFMRELADQVYSKHVVTDSSRRTFGMTYEYLRDGQKMQDFGLDTMHDGAWFMSAMATAHRIDPDGKYLDRALTYQTPFYVNILQNSDRLFPQMQPRSGQEQFSQPVKGWIPRGWDDGLGIDLDGRPFSTPAFHEGMSHPDKKASTTIHLAGDRVEHAYFTSSHHLIQDLADGLMNVWLSTRDPQVARAIMQIHQGRIEYGRQIPVVRVAAGITNNQPALFQRSQAEKFDPTALRPYYAGAIELKPERISAYNDGVAWEYRDACARAVVGNSQLDPQTAYQIAGSAYNLMCAMEAFYSDGDYRYGDWFFDLGGNQGFFTEDTGKLGRYASDGEPRLGTRGIQVSAFAAAVLPTVAAHPEVWEQRYQDDFPGDQLVRIVDKAPVLDGVKDQLYETVSKAATNGTVVSLVSDPRHLHLYVESDQPAVVLRIASLTDDNKVRQETATTLSLSPEKATARNHKGHELKLAAAVKAGNRWSIELQIPYSVVKDQASWINGVDHGRYEIRTEGANSKTFYLLSSHDRLVSRLESLVAGTISLWHDYWTTHRNIPSGYYRSGKPYRWNYGDAGNYAHLIKCVSLWMMYREGTSEWDLIKKQSPAQPIIAKPLPDSVLKVQGLK